MAGVEIQGPFDGTVTFMRVPFSRDLARSKPRSSACRSTWARIPCASAPGRDRLRSASSRTSCGRTSRRSSTSIRSRAQRRRLRQRPAHRELRRRSVRADRGGGGAIVDAGVVPVTMGGDGSVTLPQLRAAHKRHSGLVVLHIDAHTDTYPGSGRDMYNTATTFTRAAEEGVVDTAGSLHIGARGPTYMPGVFEHAREQGYDLIDGIDLFRRGIPDVLTYVHAKFRGRPIYLCFDMDFFDPELRARRLHARLGRGQCPRGTPAPPGACRPRHRRLRRQHREPASRCGRHDRVPRRHRDARVPLPHLPPAAALGDRR